MTDYLKKYSSNSVGAGANQTFFELNEGEVRTGLAFFKITAGGKYRYSLLFSDVIDSTFAGGEKSFANMQLGGWSIHSLRVGRCKHFPSSEPEKILVEEIEIQDITTLTFGDCKECYIGKGENVFSDPKELYFASGEYIAVEITYSGKRVPAHLESMLPLYNKTECGFKYSVEMPLPLMIGCDRPVKRKIAYLGDSITQGIGARANSYLNWCARLCWMIGEDFSHYNLGIGYARAEDAASLGNWLKRALASDFVFLCLGTNDIGAGANENAIISSLKTIICKLKSANCRVILQTLPPFNREGERNEAWNNINKIIKEELALEVMSVFDVVPLLSEVPHKLGRAKYGGHPNEEGCRIWAEALFKEINKYFR